MKKGDIYRWSYIDSLGSQEILYWCKSRIAIFDGERLKDTYWSSAGENHVLDLGKTEIKFVANLEDLRMCSEGERVYYEDKDCVNLNHPNASRGNFYVFNSAERSLRKMKLIQQRLIDNYKRSVEYAISALERETDAIKTITIESSVFANTDVDHFDYNGDSFND